MFAALKARLEPFYDPTAWILIAVCAGGVALFDPVMAKTILQIILMFGACAGVAVIISRHVLPQISLTSAVDKAMDDNPVAAAILVLSVAIFLSTLVYSITFWVKA